MVSQTRYILVSNQLFHPSMIKSMLSVSVRRDYFTVYCHWTYLIPSFGAPRDSFPIRIVYLLQFLRLCLCTNHTRVLGILKMDTPTLFQSFPFIPFFVPVFQSTLSLIHFSLSAIIFETSNLDLILW